MLKLLYSLGQMVWPFFKESVLEGETPGQWIRRNRVFCLWILLLTIMLGIMAWMADVILTFSHQSQEVKTQVATSTARYNALAVRYNKLVVKHNYQLSQTKLERNRVRGLRRLIADSCPQSSAAYRTLIVGIESLDKQVEPFTDVNREWCLAVRKGDLANELIRLRYLAECHVPGS